MHRHGSMSEWVRTEGVAVLLRSADRTSASSTELESPSMTTSLHRQITWRTKAPKTKGRWGSSSNAVSFKPNRPDPFALFILDCSKLALNLNHQVQKLDLSSSFCSLSSNRSMTAGRNSLHGNAALLAQSPRAAERRSENSEEAGVPERAPTLAVMMPYLWFRLHMNLMSAGRATWHCHSVCLCYTTWRGK